MGAVFLLGGGISLIRISFRTEHQHDDINNLKSIVLDT
jgi:hypothetical protein